MNTLQNVNRLIVGLFVVVCMCFMVGCQVSSAPADSSGSSSSTSTPGSTSSAGTTSPSTPTSETPGNQVTGLDGETVVGGADSSSPTAQKVAQVAANFPSQYSSSGSFPYAAGTQNGNLGCANVVSQALKDAGVNVWSLGVDDCANQCKQQGWSEVNPPPYQPGDVVVWAPGSSGHKHIGIVTKNGNSLMAMNNSSGERRPVFSEIEHRAVESVLRKA